MYLRGFAHGPLRVTSPAWSVGRMAQPTEDEIDTAYHEAAHALAQLGIGPKTGARRPAAPAS